MNHDPDFWRDVQPWYAERHGITPPPLHSARTTCPLCSHTRRKSRERCLRIRPFDGWLEWECRHCGWAEGDAV